MHPCRVHASPLQRFLARLQRFRVLLQRYRALWERYRTLLRRDEALLQRYRALWRTILGSVSTQGDMEDGKNMLRVRLIETLARHC